MFTYLLILFFYFSTSFAESITNSYNVNQQIQIGGTGSYYVPISGAPSNSIITNVEARFTYIAYGVVQNYVSARFNRGSDPGSSGGGSLVNQFSLPSGNPGTYGWISFSNWNGQNANSNYYFRFALASSSPFTATINSIEVRVTYSINTPPNPPTLSSPNDYSIFNKNSTSQINFQWNSVSGALEYHLTVFRSGNSANPIFNSSVGTSTSYSINPSTWDNNEYIWYVKVRTNSGWSSYSADRKLIVDTPPPIPTFLTPSNGSTFDIGSSTNFTWSAPSGATIASYKIKIVAGTDISSNPILETETTSTSQNVSFNANTYSPGTYTWSLKAIKVTPNGYNQALYQSVIGWCEYSTTQTFTITETVPLLKLAFPLLNYSPNNAPLSSIFDHTMSFSYEQLKDKLITAYNGEQGNRDFSWDHNYQTPGFGKDRIGSPIILNGHYIYKNTSSGSYLYYNGHPGIDFAPNYNKIHVIRASASGEVYIPSISSPKLGYKDTKKWGIIIVDHAINKQEGYRILYLHTASRPDLPESEKTRLVKRYNNLFQFQQVLDTISSYPITNQLYNSQLGTRISVEAGDIIGVVGMTGTGGMHLHFEVQYYKKDINGNIIDFYPVDPYGYLAGAQADPYTRDRRPSNEKSRWLWADPYQNSSNNNLCNYQDTLVLCNNYQLSEDWLIHDAMSDKKMLGIVSPSENRLVTCGVQGTIIFSSDNGSSWQHTILQTDRNLNAICFANSTTGLIVGDNTILKTTDSGQNWEKKWFSNLILSDTSQYFYSLRTVFTSSENIIYIGGHWVTSNNVSPVLLKSTDCGETWSRLFDFAAGEYDEKSIAKIHFFDDLNGIAVISSNLFSENRFFAGIS